MKSNNLTRFASAVVMGAVALAGVTTPAMAQGKATKAERATQAERVQKNKVQKTTTVQRTEAAPKSVKVDRSAQRAPKSSTVVREPKVTNQEPVRRQPRVVDQTPVVKEPKATRNTGRVRTADPVVVQPNDKPNRTNTKPLPSRPVQVEDGVIDRRSPTVNPNRQTNNGRVQPNDRVVNRAARVPDTVQRTRIAENRTRASSYNQYLIRQNRLADQRRDQLRQQRRLAQARYMEDYWRRQALQQQQVNQWQSYNYNNDAYFYTPASYRYNYGGRYYETNQYGRNMLEQAVNEGYREGYYAGRADHEDSWRYNYQNSYAYQDANSGYNGFYVSQTQYNYYFRQGFQRGYEDGYYSRSNYGHSNGGTIAILAGVLGTILVLDAIND